MEALFVTFLWSSSYILVKVGLTQLSPLALVSLRYIVASAILVSFALVKGRAHLLNDRNTLLKVVFLGMTGYTLAQGLQVFGLLYLPAVSVTFILNFTPLTVLILSILLLQEYPTKTQLAGMVLILAGAIIFFNAPLPAQSLMGVLITLLSGVGWAVYLVAGRMFFAKEEIDPLGLTAFSMGLGSLFIAVPALTLEAITEVSLSSWAIILWLAIVNTAIAFFLWNYALQRIEAFEISVLQNTMLIQIGFLAWIFLGEKLTIVKLTAMALVFSGTLIVQLRR